MTFDSIFNFFTQNKGKRLQEGGHINKSLLALGNCISALSHGTKALHLNFRDSKLTRLLREPLSGNYRTVMIAQVNPASEFREDIKNTLIFASKAMGITRRVNIIYVLPRYTKIALHYQLHNFDSFEKLSKHAKKILIFVFIFCSLNQAHYIQEIKYPGIRI